MESDKRSEIADHGNSDNGKIGAIRRLLGADSAGPAAETTGFANKLSDVEIYAIRQILDSPSGTRNINNGFAGRMRTIRCWNCEREGHVLRECREPRKFVLCYRCGRRNTTTANCPDCSKNGVRDGGNQGSRQ